MSHDKTLLAGGPLAKSNPGNDTFATATSIGFESRTNVTMNVSDDKDYFRFSASFTGDLSIVLDDFDNVPDPDDLDLLFYTASEPGLILYDDQIVGWTDVSTTQSVTAGTEYIIQLNYYDTSGGNGTESATLTLSPSDPTYSDGNDLLETAEELDLGILPVSGIIGPDDPDDFYSVTALGYGTYTFSLFDLYQDLDIDILDRNGTEIDFGRNFGSTSELVSIQTMPGEEYFIDVYGLTGGISQYSLNVEYQPSGPDLSIFFDYLPEIVFDGTSVPIGFQVDNFGAETADFHDVRFIVSQDGDAVGSFDLGYDPIASEDNSGPLSQDIASFLNSLDLEYGKFEIELIVDPDDLIQEGYENNNSTDPFSVTYLPAPDMNESFSTATPLTFESQMLSDSLSDFDERDFYSFTTSGSGTLTVTLESQVEKIDLLLYDALVPFTDPGFLLVNSPGIFNGSDPLPVTLTYDYGDGEELILLADFFEAGTIEFSPYDLDLLIEPDLPDFTASNLTISNPILDGTLDFDIDINNVGLTADSPGSVSIYFSSDNLIDTSDVPLGDLPIDEVIAADGSLEVAFEGIFDEVFAETYAPGTYYIGAIVDAVDTVEETDETNNVSNVLAVTLPGLDPKPIVGTDGPDTLVGTDGDDTIGGGLGGDSLEGGEGNDNMSGSNGNDTIKGGGGNDNIGGGLDDDTIEGGAGNDTIGAGQGNDTADGGEGDDIVNGGGGNDSLTGGVGNDTMGASFGTDTVFGSDGNDSLGGGTGMDFLDGGAGDDSIGGGEGDDTVLGGAGNDFLAGGGRDDSIVGGSGNDTINGGAGDDVMTGDGGVATSSDADLFVFNALVSGEVDVILDFDDGLDKLRLTGVTNPDGGGKQGLFDALTLTEGTVEGVFGTAVSYNGHTIGLVGISAADLSVDDFIFL